MIRTVVPPYILNKIISNGASHQQNCARQTLTHIQSLMAAPQSKPRASQSAKAGSAVREIYDAYHSQNLPGELVRSDTQQGSDDVAVKEAWEYLGVTYDFYWQAYQRNSLDNRGLSLLGSVHYGQDYQNAFWNGQQMVFGDGDGEIFNRFTIAIDVVAHELTHGVTESEAGLTYSGQSGALNESVSDVFGSLVKQFHLQQTADQADWLIGEHLLAKGIKGKGLRSMSHPGSAYDDPLLGKDPQPDAMTGYIETRDDNGGVHLNSGIANRAFYLAASAIGGFAWEKAGYAWYDTICDSALPQDADFKTFARLTVNHAKKRFDDKTASAIEAAWQEVGVL
ncbi:peptidase M4 family protein [Izhakiella australiensis]|uniref:Neutral metalloproteinase n=1 Tax=Izhakiella australiensis TaxID=1926881 RepID=A0A1S8YFD9_9GAMM|nr:M4 family metallopeptidase [Izhakiella australiensis]OON37562.1 peptidase M4 family protein [Izhakiella australiensis]